MRFFRTLSYFFLFISALSLLGSTADAQTDKYKMKYRGMDRNHDGVITRSEWRGKDRSFRNQDWNSDGILSGYEVRAGAKRADYKDDYDGRDRDNDNTFVNLDYDRDNYISKNEWRGGLGAFERRDCDRDSLLTRNEFFSRTECNTTVSYGTFPNLDNNNDGYLSRREWRDSAQTFTSKDCDRDERVSRMEYFTKDCASNTCDFDCVFRELDVNNDGLVYRTEWRGNAQTFDSLDQNRDNYLNRSELSYINQRRQGSTQQQVMGTVSEVLNSIFGR